MASNRNQGGSNERGFAGMDPERQREIASKGGQAAHQKGTAHEFSSEEAREAGARSHGGRGAQATDRSSGQMHASSDNRSQQQQSTPSSRSQSGSSGQQNPSQQQQNPQHQQHQQSQSGDMRGGSSEQHSQAGRQSHKNDR